ncbi:hypothetical protein [Pantoea agglomerans]|uniref:hypothetical protein n=1 Tax=Enterobacter agglomerans TaxID=549 RepID=UPI001F011BAC|nr:hypothetical protein [Pantoea agglomerans]
MIVRNQNIRPLEIVLGLLRGAHHTRASFLHPLIVKYLMTVAQGMAVQAKAGVTREKLQPMVDYVISGWSR